MSNKADCRTAPAPPGLLIINWQYLNYRFFATFRVSSLPEKNFTTIFLLIENQIFCKPYIFSPGLKKRSSGVYCQTVTYNEWNWPKELIIIQNFMFWEIFQVFGSDNTPVPEVTKLRFFLPRCPLLFTCWLSWLS